MTRDFFPPVYSPAASRWGLYNMVNKVSVGIRMAAVRKMLGLRQKDWADELNEGIKLYNIARTNVSKWEGGAAYPPEEVYEYIFSKYGISVDWLLFESWQQLRHGDVDPLERALAAVKAERARIKQTQN